MIALFKTGSYIRKIFQNNFIWIILLGLSTICGAATIIIANADFKGDWTFNEQKSKLAEGRRMNALKMKVSQEGDALVIQRTTASQNGDNVVTTEKLTFDGKTAESTVNENLKRKSTASWAADGQQMTINSTLTFERDGNSVEIKVVEIWKLSDGGKSLSIDYTLTSPRGTSTNTLLYDKS